MSQCSTSTAASPELAPLASAGASVKPVQFVPKAVLNAHGCGGDCTVEDDSQARWPRAEVLALFNLPFNDLMWQAQQVHRALAGAERGAGSRASSRPKRCHRDF